MKPESIKDLPHYCYLITNIINDKVYVGVTYKDINDRLKEHLKVSKYKSNKHKQSINHAIFKYGIDNFKIEILEEFDNYASAYLAESLYIKKYNSRIYGYNETDGGDCGPVKLKYKKDTIIDILTKYCEGYTIVKLSKDTGISYNSIFDLIRLRFSKLYNIPQSLIDQVIEAKSKSKYKHKITDDFTKIICRDYLKGNTMDEIAMMHNICTNTVWNVLHKQTNKIIIDKLSINNKNHINKDTVINIIEDFISDYSIAQLSYKYDISKNNIRYILRRKIWKNIILDPNIEFQLIEKINAKKWKQIKQA